MVEEESLTKRKGRGPGKKPALFCTSIRLPVHVIEYFNENHPRTKQAMMRQVLSQYVDSQLEAKGANDGTSS